MCIIYINIYILQFSLQLKKALEFTLRVAESNCIWIDTYVIRDQVNN